MQDNIK